MTKREFGAHRTRSDYALAGNEYGFYSCAAAAGRAGREIAMSERPPLDKDRRPPIALILISALFLVPIGLLLALFLQESRKDINFIDKEIAGLAYARAVWPVIPAVLASRGAHADLAMRRWDDIRAAGEAYDAEMGTLDARLALGRALSHAGDWRHSKAEILGAAAALITKIDDGSNLTLDSDLESFYIIDSVTVKLPSLALQSEALFGMGAAAPTTATSDRAALEARVDAERFVERFRAGLAAFDNSVDSIARAAGVPHPAIAAARDRIDNVATAAANRPSRAPANQLNGSETSEAAPSDEELAGAEGQFWDSATGELDRILNARLNRLRHAQWINLLVVAAVCLTIFSIVGFIAFSANRGIDKIVRTLRRR